VVDQALAELAGVVPDDGAGGAEGPMARWQMARAVSDLRLLGAMLDECPYRMLSTRVQLSGGAGSRAGALLLLLPVPRRAAPPVQAAGHARPGPALTGGQGQGGGDPFQSALELAVLGAPVVLNTVLGRIPMTLSDAMALSVGQRLELPLSQLEDVQVIGLDGQPQAQARLGQSRGMRALRIITLAEGADALGDPGTGKGPLLEGRVQGPGLSAPPRTATGSARGAV
jgi:flagellar motor switch protein FliM